MLGCSFKAWNPQLLYWTIRILALLFALLVPGVGFLLFKPRVGFLRHLFKLSIFACCIYTTPFRAPSAPSPRSRLAGRGCTFAE